MEKATQFLNRFQQAKTSSERRAVADEYRLYVAGLTGEQKEEARLIRRPVLDESKASLTRVESMTSAVDALIKGKLVH